MRGPVQTPRHSFLSTQKHYIPSFFNKGLDVETYPNSSTNSCTTTSCKKLMVVVVSTTMCNGVPFLLNYPLTKKAYVSQIMGDPCCKSYTIDVLTLAAIHFAVVANHLWFHNHPQILIITTRCVVAMLRFGWRSMTTIRPCLQLSCVAS